MQVTITRRIRVRSARCLTLMWLALIVGATPVMVEAGDATAHFDIKAQPLSEALMAFGVQTGTIVMASSELTTGKVSKPVAGELTRQEALNRMLEGSGLKFETNVNGTILIVRVNPADR